MTDHPAPATHPLLGRHPEFLDSLGGQASQAAVVLSRCLNHLAAQRGALTEADLYTCVCELREYGAAEVLEETAAGTGSPWAAWCADLANRLEAYLVGRRLVPVLPFVGKVGAAGSGIERRAAETYAATAPNAARYAIAAERRLRPAWQAELVERGVAGMRETFARPLPAILWTEAFHALVSPGPGDMFRVIIRHHGGLDLDEAATEADRAAVAATREALGALGLLPAEPASPSAVLDGLSKAGGVAVLSLGRSLNCWLREEDGRWRRPEGYPVLLPMPPRVRGELGRGLIKLAARSAGLRA